MFPLGTGLSPGGCVHDCFHMEQVSVLEDVYVNVSTWNRSQSWRDVYVNVSTWNRSQSWRMCTGLFPNGTGLSPGGCVCECFHLEHVSVLEGVYVNVSTWNRSQSWRMCTGLFPNGTGLSPGGCVCECFHMEQFPVLEECSTLQYTAGRGLIP